MSLNKVLNRPLFRKEALRKGALKPITAQTGIMVGEPISTGQQQMNPRTQVPAVKPNIFRRAVGDVRAFAQRPGQFFNPRTGRFVPGVGTAGLIATGGLAPIVGMGRRKLGISDESAFAPIIDYGIGGLLSINPFFRAAGMAAQAGRFGLGAVDYLKKQPIGTSRTNIFPQDLGQPLGLFGPIDPNKPRGRGAVKKATEERKRLAKQADAEGSEVAIATPPLQPDALAQPKNETEIGGKKVVDLDKTIQGDRIPNVNMVGDPAQFYKDDPFLTSKPEAPIEEPKKDLPKKEETVTTQANTKRNALSQQLELAKQIQAEMMEGRPSNARTIFLTNLATGLLTGTTRKKGLGGALEVFGQALGPAVNNSVMVRMKEDELNDRLLERAMDFSINYLKAQNDALKIPDTKDIGVIQYTNKNGVVINQPGRVLKDGTKQIATGRIVNGISEYRTVPATTRFIKNNDANKETLEIAGDLGGKYGALKLINRSLGIIERGDAEGGVVGLFGLYSGRLTDAIGDIFDYGKETNVEAGRTEFNIEKRKAAVRLVNSGEFKDITEAERYLNKQLGANFDSIYKKNLNQIKKKIKDGKKLDYERLAINETVLVYRLANSLKSKDRLTQKDIQMAKELVKVFPAFRGEASVISSLIAVSETIMDDIKEKENLYLQAGGGTEFLVNSRIDAGLIPAQGADFDNLTPFVFQQLEQRKKSVGAKSQEELKKILEGVPTK
jgi:hypothetical protein